MEGGDGARHHGRRIPPRGAHLIEEDEIRIEFGLLNLGLLTKKYRLLCLGIKFLIPLAYSPSCRKISERIISIGKGEKIEEEKKVPKNLDPIHFYLSTFHHHHHPSPIPNAWPLAMDRLSSPARLMIVSDLDHTMVDHHDPENLSLLRFNALWEFYYRHDSLLVFSTGRSPTLYKELRKEKPLLTPDITIMSVGTEITYGTTMVPDDGWVEILNEKWDRNVVIEETSKFPELTLQSETEQRPHKISFYVDKAKAQEVTTSLSTRLGERGLDVKIIYSGGMDLDILPQGAGKGQALAYLHKKFTLEGKLPANTLVCGDSGNDAELFSIPNVHGVMVSNAQEELLQWHAENAKDNPKIIHATERCAGGIIQAIGHFGLGPNESPRDVTDVARCHTENANPGHEVVNFNLFYERWRRAEVENCETYIASLKAVCHPSGYFVHPSGLEQPLHDSISAIRRIYGDKQGKEFRVWVDSVLPMQISSDTWVVRFKKLESCGEERHSCLCTAVLTSSKEVGGLEIFTWMHLHETWLKGSEAKDSASWLL